MKHFGDILVVSDAILADAIPMMEMEQLGLSLKTATREFKAKFFSNMPERDAARLRELMEWMAPVRLADVEAAQHVVSAIVFTLEAEREDDSGLDS